MKSAFKENSLNISVSVTIGSNDLIAGQEYTEQQHQNYELIKSLHDGGMDIGRLHNT